MKDTQNWNTYQSKLKVVPVITYNLKKKGFKLVFVKQLLSSMQFEIIAKNYLISLMLILIIILSYDVTKASW